MPQSPWRLLDTGVLSGARNMALDRTLVAVRGRGLSPNTVRFLQFSPPVALVGVYQVVEQEVRLDYCRERGIDVNRRITGGGSLLFDEVQLGWELIAGLRDFDCHPMSLGFQRRICEAAIAGLRDLGIEAAFRPRNDIEARGRKISGTGGVEDGDAFLFQGTLLLDFDVASMIKALRIPTEKLKQSSIDDAADRVTWVAKELGYLPPIREIKTAIARGFERVFGVALEPADLLPVEAAEYEKNVPFFESDEWVHGARRRPSQLATISGLHRNESAAIRVHLAIDAPRKRLRSALLSGDFFLHPQRAIYDLEARLKDVRLDGDLIAGIVRRFWDETHPRAQGFGAADVCKAIRAALAKLEFLKLGFTLSEVEKLLAVNGQPAEILAKDIDLVLLPYCAKASGCEHRYAQTCAVCGECAVGGAFDAAQEAGMRPVTIINFEHLMETLERERRRGAAGYLGSCCEAFFHKHYADFQRAALPGILVDVSRATCYDLNQAREAYAGQFEGQTDLDADLMKKLIAVCTARQIKSNASQAQAT
ncbi:MAG: DUF116 domain-containing protein [Candidatus Sumerlaeota bacterium]|nr:DUF116 domain-containing protein [Candidatus Sumerlaeota bacterium]